MIISLAVSQFNRRAAGGGGGGLDPSMISSATLECWLRADLGVTVDGFTNVSAWLDQSTAGDAARNAGQSTAGNRPPYVATDAAYNNQATIGPFTGSQYLIQGTWSASPSQPFTVVVVGNSLDTATNYYFLDSISGDRLPFVDVTGSVYMGSGAGPSLIASGVPAHAPSIIYGELNGLSSTLRVNAATPAITGDGGAGTFNGLVIGCYQGLILPLGGPLAEVVVFSGLLSGGDRTGLLSYLSTRYGIAVGP